MTSQLMFDCTIFHYKYFLKKFCTDLSNGIESKVVQLKKSYNDLNHIDDAKSN